ncbi:MAG: lipopolysaccharide heptosyltransferase II, partial [Limisphaerales bacterium]
MTPSRLLVRGVNWLGDAVMTTPALLRLRAALPAARVTLLTPAKLAQLWTTHPAVDEVLPLAAGEGVFAAARRLRAGRFDAALILPNSPRSALEAWLARIPRRLGLARPWRTWMLTQPLPPRPDEIRMKKRSIGEIHAALAAPFTIHHSPFTQSLAAHHVHHYLHLAAALGADPAPVAPQLSLAPDEQAQARAGLPGVAPATGTLWAGLNPGAEYGPAKRWPAERFVAAAREVSERTGCRWAIFGGARDVELAAGIAAELPGSVNLAGRTTLRELMVALAACRVLLTNDTGPMHVAAALGVPVVVPFGSTSPELTGPGLPGDARHALLRGQAPCAPCFLRECP